MSDQDEKLVDFATKIGGAIAQVFDEDSDFYISDEELAENVIIFFHALANSVPTHLFNSMTGDNKNQLQFNHIANQLCFQFSTKKRRRII